nr:zinc dependent phospholipase C family protein [uncultured Merdimonas sp.]
MPAFYAHDRFGKKVAERLPKGLKATVKGHYRQYRIGLQGPDLFFFYQPYRPNRVTKYGNHLHEISAMPFFEHAVKVVRKKGEKSREYAYLMGFVCHFILDSECHPYVESYIKKSGVQHLEIEEEFEKKLMRMDGKDPFSYPTARLVPVDIATADAIWPFYENISRKTVMQSLKDLRLIKRLFTAPGRIKHGAVNTALKMTGHYASMKGLMNQRKDNPKCRESNEELMKHFDAAVDLAVRMIISLDESIWTRKELDERFDRTFS